MRVAPAIKLLFLATGFALLSSCNSGKLLFPIEPQISFLEISPKEIYEPKSIDDTVATLYVTIHYTDGDGDLGAAFEGDTIPNFFLIDQRPNLPLVIDSQVVYDGVLNYTMPSLSPEARKPSIQGEITIKLQGLVQRIDKNVDSEQVWFNVQIKDRAGNLSNVVQTDTIVVHKPL